MATTQGWSRQLSRRGLILGGTAACLLAGTGAGAAAHAARDVFGGHPHPVLEVDPRAVVAVQSEAASVALTFDDGPDPAYTPAVLEILAHFGTRATFFMIGRNAAAHPDLVREVLLAGHSIGNHTQDHLWLRDLSAREVSEQIENADQTLRGAAAAPGDLFRPPRGLTSATVASVTRRLGVRSYFWNACLEANLHHGVSAAAEATADHCRPGAIILCHDGGHLEGPNPQHIDRSRSVAALPGLLTRLRDRGLQPVTLPVLMAAATSTG